LSIAALCVPLLGGSAGAAEASGVSASTNSPAATITVEDFRKILDEVQALRNQVKELNSELSTVRSAITNTAAPVVNKDDVKQLQDEVQALKGANETNSAAIKAVSATAATKQDVEALRDIEDEQTLRSIGSSSSISSYTVNGYQHLVNLTGYGILGYTSVIGPSQASTWESFKLSGIGLTLSGYARNDPSRDGDVRFNLGLIGSPTKYLTGFTATPTYGYIEGTNGKPTKVITGLTTSSTSTTGTYVNAGDIWLAYDLKTAKLELEPTWTMSLQLGQFLTPYGLENPSTENNRPTVNKAQYIS
jgi:prefoldin subunit 5